MGPIHGPAGCFNARRADLDPSEAEGRRQGASAVAALHNNESGKSCSARSGTEIRDPMRTFMLRSSE